MLQNLRDSRIKITLLGLGLLIMLISLMALAYGLLPAQVSQVTATLAPTYFIPPVVTP